VLFAAIAILAIYATFCVSVGYFTFSPLSNVVGIKPKAGFRVQLSDVLAFPIFFQLAFGILNWSMPDMRWNFRLGVVVFAVILSISTVSWIYGIRILRRMNTRSWKKRLTLLGLTMPVGLMISGLAMPYIFMCQTPHHFVARFLVVFGVAFAVRSTSVWVSQQPSAPETA